MVSQTATGFDLKRRHTTALGLGPIDLAAPYPRPCAASAKSSKPSVELVDGGDLATAFKDATGDGVDVILAV